MGIELGMTRKEIEARFGPGVPAPAYSGLECAAMIYPMPDTRSGAYVEYTTRSCVNRASGWATQISTSNRFAAFPDGVRMNSTVPDPLARERWNGYRSFAQRRGFGYHWRKQRWSKDRRWWYEISLEVFAGIGGTARVSRMKVEYGGTR